MTSPDNTDKQQHDEILTEPEAESEDESVVTADSGKSRKIFTAQLDREVRSFRDDREMGNLDLQPDFQRHSIWNQAQSSRLIESALLDVPLPAVYLFEEASGVTSVIDGQQRLTAFISFVRGNFLDEGGEPFALSGLRALTGLNGRKFDELKKEEQNKILGTTIRTVIFQKECDPDLKYEVFERLNTEATSLKDQELRNCVYRGPYNRLLTRLSQIPDFQRLMGISKPEKRMRDVEYVLRFAAFYHANHLGYRPPMKRFLNKDMEMYRKITDKDAKQLEQAFKKAVRIIGSLLRGNAFKRYVRGASGNPNGHWEPKQFNASLYDVLMWQFSQDDPNVNLAMRNLDSLREGLINLMTMDDEFLDAITRSTSSANAVTVRFDKFRAMVAKAIGDDQQQPRFFPLSMKEEFYNKDPSCKICGQRIMGIDDAAMDHIVPYAAGGETTLENAQLTHRYCNWAKGDKPASDAG